MKYISTRRAAWLATMAVLICTPALSVPAAAQHLGAKVYQSFAITDDAIIFYIGQGMWLPEVDGPQRVSIPRAELAALLA